MLAVLVAIFLSAPAAAQQAAREIDQLATALGKSGCDFQRNGSWHTAAKAEEHLRRKYDYLRERGKVATAEQFIALAGTQSSVSGRAYRVRCPRQPVMDSAAWLHARLQEIRNAEATGHSPR